MENWSFRRILRKTLSVILVLSMVIGNVPVFASWNEDEDPTGNNYDESIVSALEDVCGDEYDPIVVLDRLYSVGVIDENGYPKTTATFNVDGETMTTDELVDAAENHSDTDAVTIDGEETTWGNVNTIMQYLKTIEILEEVTNTDGEMTEEHAANFYSLLTYLGSTDELNIEDYAGIMTTFAGSAYPSSWPSNISEAAIDYTWYASGDSNGSGISQTSVINISLNQGTTVNQGTTIKATVELTEAQPVEVSLKYRVVAGSWSKASVSGDNTLTWNAGEKGQKTFNIYVNTDSDDGTNGTESFVVQIYDIKNALCNGSSSWQQIISVNRSHEYKFSYSYTTDNLTTQASNDNKCWKTSDSHPLDEQRCWITNETWNITGVPDGLWKWRCKYNLYASISDGDSDLTIEQSEVNVTEKNYWSGDVEFMLNNAVVKHIALIRGDGKDSGAGQTTNPGGDSLWFGRHSQEKSVSTDWTAWATNTSDELNSASVPFTIRTWQAYKDGGIASERMNQRPAAKLTVSFEATEVTDKGEIQSVTIPDGTFYPGQVVPITVKTSFPLKIDGNLQLTVNGQTVTAYETASQSKCFTFYYTVRELDTGTINVTGISSSVTGANEYSGFTLSNADKAGILAGTNTNCKLVTPAKTASFTSTSIAIDDEMPCYQTITVDMPISDFSEAGNFPYISWIASNTKVLDEEITLTDKDGNEVTVKGYVKSMYVSYDGGKTRYPLYVAIKNQAVTIYKPDGSAYQTDEFPIKLVCNIAPTMNATTTLRRDTVEIFMDPEIGSTYDYVTTGCTEATDDNGYTYYIKGEDTKDAQALIGSYGQVYVKNAVILEDDYEYSPDGETTATWHDVKLVNGDALENLLSKSTTSKAITLADGETEITRKVAEVYAQDENVYNITGEVQNRPDGSYGKDDFTFTAQKYMLWNSSDPTVATIDENGYISFTGKAGEVYFWLNVTNGGVKDFAYCLYSDIIEVKAGLTPYIQIPSTSRTKLLVEGEESNIAFSSNLTERNKAEKGDDFATEFTLKLYDYNDVVINGKTATPKANANAVYTTTKSSPADYTDASGEVSIQPVSSIAIAEDVLKKTDNSDYDYVVIISATAEATGNELSCYAVIKVQTAPAKVKLAKLDNYYVTDDAIPDINYTVSNVEDDSEIYYVVQQSGGNAQTSKITHVAKGSIDKSYFTAAAGQLKTIYTVTVYARRYADDAWSADSLTLTVYDHDALEIIVSKVDRGSLGGYTGGKASASKNVNEDGTYTMENISYIENLLNTKGNQVEIDGTNITIEQLQNDLNLQAVVSINYGDYVWGMLSDQIQWSSSDHDVASLDYYQGGMYSDIESYTYPSYLPATDFLLVGHENGKTTLTATHAINGMEDTVEVTVKTLKDKFYIFQFMPEMEVKVSYTNGNGVTSVLYSNKQGQIAIYEPSGIASDVTVLSTDLKYSASIAVEDLYSSEQNIAALQLYPVNNVKLHNVSEAQICVMDENGRPVSGQTVTVRAGVFRDGEYCPNAEFKISDDNYDLSRNGRSDITMTTDSNGMLKFMLNPEQFYVNNTKEAEEYTNDIMYIFELDYGDDYYPEIVKLETYATVEYNTSSPTTSTTRTKRVGAKAPFIEGIEELQYSGEMGSWTANSYTLDLADCTSSIGPNAFYKQVVLDTTIMLWGYDTVQETATSYASLPDTITSNSAVVLINTEDNSVPEGQMSDVIQTEAVTKLADTYGEGELSFYVYPFSSIPLARNGYVMNAETFGGTGKTVLYTDEYGLTCEVKEYTYLPFIEEMSVSVNLTLNGKNAVNEQLEFGITNLIDQEYVDADDGALAELIEESDKNLSKNMDLAGVLDEIDMTDFLKLPFKFIAKIALKLTGGKMVTNIFPTSSPSKFYMLMTPSELQLPWTSSNAKVTYNQDTRLDNATSVLDEMDISGPGGESYDMGFSGYVLLEATYRLDGWHIRTVSGSVKACTGELGKTFKWNMFVGPVPVNFCIGIGGAIRFDFSYMDRGNGYSTTAMDQLIDITLRLYIYLFGGIGVDTSIARLKVGVYGKIGVNIELARLRSALLEEDFHGQKVSIDGEVGITFMVGILLVTYEKILASTKFEIAAWTFNDYDNIMKYWRSGDLSDLTGASQVFALTSYEGEDVTLTTYPDGTMMVEVDRATTQDRDYLDAAEREWINEPPLLFSMFTPLFSTVAQNINYANELQTNSYPYSNPVYTDDGQYMLYLSDADVSTEAISAVAWADISNRSNVIDKGTFKKYETVFAAGTRYTSTETELVSTIATPTAVTVKSYNVASQSAVFYFNSDVTKTEYTATDLRTENADRIKTYIVNEDGSRELASDYNTDSLTACGTDGNYFAAWSRHTEEVTKEMGTKVNNDDLAMTMQTSEVVVAHYDSVSKKWTEQQLTDDMVGDFSPAIASWGNKAIVVWQRGASSGTNPLDMNVENELYYSIWDSNTSAWSSPKSLGAINGTLKSFDTAILEDGTAIVSYIIETGEDEESTTDAEACYSVIAADGSIKTGFARLTNDTRTDSNVDVIAVIRNKKQQFLMSWLTQIDRDGNSDTTADTYNDLSVAAIDKDGNKDPFFIDSIQANEETSVGNPYVLVGSSSRAFEDVAVVWTESVQQKLQDDGTYTEAYDHMMFIKFWEMDGTQGVTASVEVERMDENVTIDHFDAYIQSDGELEAVILGSDYNQTASTKTSTIPVSNVITLSNGESADLSVTTTQPVRNLYTAYASLNGPAITAEEAYFDFSDAECGFQLPIQISVTNSGTEKLTKATIKVRKSDETSWTTKDYNISLLPGKTYNLIYNYTVPTTSVRDVEYEVVLYNESGEEASCNDASNEGLIELNIPDIGIKETTVAKEIDGTRTIEVKLYRAGNIPFENSEKIVKLAFYKDSDMTEQIGDVITISSDDYALIDMGIYRYQKTMNIEDMTELVYDEVTGAYEMPAEGFDIYTYAWVENNDPEESIVDELKKANNSGFVTVTSMLERNRRNALTETDDIISKKISVSAEGDVNLLLQNISLGSRSAIQINRIGNVRAKALNASGEAIGVANTFNFDNPSTDDYIALDKEASLELTRALKLNDGESADDIKSWEIEVYNERYTTYYTWDNVKTGDKVVIPNGTFTSEESKSEGDYSYAGRYVNYGFTTAAPCTPTQGSRKFIGWFEVVGYYDGDSYHYAGEDGFTAEDLAKIDFEANPTYSRILASEAYDFEGTQLEKDTVLFALFSTINVVDPDNYYMPLTEDTKIEVVGHTDDSLTDDIYTLVLELVGAEFTEDFELGTVLNTNIDGVQVKYIEKLGKNIRNNDIVRVQVMGTLPEGFEDVQLVIDPGQDAAKYFSTNAPVKSTATAYLTVSIKAFYQVHHDLDGAEKETEVGYAAVGTTLNPDTFKKDYTGYHYVNGTQGKVVSKDKTTEITLNYTANEYVISYNKGSLAIDSQTGSEIGEITGSTASTNAKYDSDVQLAECGYTYGGYKFNGWNTKADGSGVNYATGSTVKNLAESGNVTLYAQWTEAGDRSYVVEYYFQSIDENGVSSYVLDSSKTSTYTGVTKGAIVKAEAKSFEGYEFSADNSLNVTSAEIIRYEDEITKLKLYYDLEKLEVNFFAPGAIGGFTGRYAIGSVITVPDNDEISYPGYKLVGWNTEADGSGETIELFKKAYVESEDGEYIYNHDTDSYVSAEGYSSKLTRYSYADVPNTITVTEAASYYAEFAEVKYNVNLIVDAGYSDVVTYTGDEAYTAQGNNRVYEGSYGEVLTLPTVSKTVNGVEQNFIGWFTSTDPQTAVAAPEFIDDSDVTYYAVFGTEYTVKYIFQDIESAGSKTPVWDESLTEEIRLWGNKGELTQAVAEDVPGFTRERWHVEQQTIGEDTVVEIYYRRNSYSIHFDLNGGKLADSGRTYYGSWSAYGSDIIAPNVVREGYYFAGWDSEVADTVPAGNVTYTAQWVKKPYIIQGEISNLEDGAELYVAIRRGDNVLSHKQYTVSGATQSYEFSPLISGLYQIDISMMTADGYCSMSEGISATEEILESESEKIITADITMPELNQGVYVFDDYGEDISVSGLGAILSESINKGENITMIFSLDEATDTEELKAIDYYAAQNTRRNIMSFEAVLGKYVRTLDEGGRTIAITDSIITDTNGKYIELAIPCSYEDVEVYRVHNGKAETVGTKLPRRYVGEAAPHEGWYFDADNDVLYVYIDSLCTFAVAIPNEIEALGVVFSTEIEHGYASVTGIKNDVITISTKAESGYVLESLSVVGENGTVHELTKIDDNTYTFILEGDNVKVNASFGIRFTDVPEDSYYADAVVWAYNNGIAYGVNDEQTLFAPSSKATRAQLVTFLWRAAGTPEPEAKTSGFGDVVSGSYYEKAVCWALENGITKGTGETSFSPEKYVSRAETVTFLARMCGISDDAEGCSHEFTDVTAEDYYNNAVAWAAENGITNGTGDGKFDPDGQTLRSQIAAFLYRCFGKEQQ